MGLKTMEKPRKDEVNNEDLNCVECGTRYRMMKGHLPEEVKRNWRCHPCQMTALEVKVEEKERRGKKLLID